MFHPVMGRAPLFALPFLLIGLLIGTVACESDLLPVQREPLIVVNTDVLEFGDVRVDDSARRMLTLTNPGSLPLVVSSVSVVPSTAGFEADAAGFTIGFDSDGSLDVTFVPQEAGAAEALLVILSNAGNARERSVTLKGRGVVDQPPPPPETGPPSITGATIMPDAPREADVVRAVATGWSDPDGDPPDFRYAWTVNGMEVSTTATLTGADFDKGDRIGVTVTPFDGVNEGAPVAVPPVVAVNTPPSMRDVMITPSVLRTTTDATATPFGWMDPDPADVQATTYAWLVQGVAVAGVTGATLDASMFVRDDSVQAVATPFDGEDSGPPVMSDVALVMNTPPGAPAIMISPTAPTPNDALMCAVSTPSADDDGDMATYTFAWTRDGMPAGSTAMIASNATATGEVWACLATPNDGFDDGAAAMASVTIGGGMVNGTIVFKSSQTTTGNIGGVAGADNFCQRVAREAGLRGTYRAWLSASARASSPAARFTRSNGPYVMLNGTVIANSWADLTDGSIQAPIGIDERGAASTTNNFVFSFTQTDGTPGLFGNTSSDCYGGDCHCNGWTTAAAQGNPTPGSAVARSNFVDDDWTDYSFGNFCGSAYSLYCFEQ